jgi:Na+/H+ antiporter NhaC
LVAARTRRSGWLPALIGLALAAALLGFEPDRERLVADGLSRILIQDYERAFGEAEPGNRSNTLFGALDRECTLTGATAVAIGIERPQHRSQWDEALFHQSAKSSLNLYNAGRRERGLAPLRILSESVPGSVRMKLVIRERADGITVVSTIGRESSGRRVLSIEPWRLPGRDSLIPALLAIGVALITRRPLISLFVGVAVGSMILRADVGFPDALVSGFLDVFRVYLRNEVVDSFRIEIIGFIVALLAMVGVMSRSGGVVALIDLLSRYARTVRSTLAATFGMGLMLFFDDYANCLLVGSTMRPLTDRLRISREKLAYMVDSTAAPIAGISILSTWIAFEVSTYSAQLPGVGIMQNAYAIFLQTLPFRFYCLFTLLFVGLLVLTGRDFGPMRAAEKRARTTGELVREGGSPLVSEEFTRVEPSDQVPPAWRNGFLPLVSMLVITLTEIFRRGGGFRRLWDDPLTLFSFESISEILFEGSGAGPIFVGALVGFWIAAFLAGSNVARVALLSGLAGILAFQNRAAEVLAPGVSEGLLDYAAAGLSFGATAAVAAIALWAVGLATTRPHLPWREISRSALVSARSLGLAVVLLFEAWMIGAVCRDLHTADYLVALTSGAVDPLVLPIILFTLSGMVAFSTGSSWSTMAILLPNVVGLADAVGASHPIGGTGMVIVCIGAVLEGSIFGDHCSPISDTTVLSSVSSASDHIDHVRTQMPYALTTASLAILLGYLPTLLWEWWSFGLSMAAALGAVTLLLWGVGRRVEDAEPLY